MNIYIYIYIDAHLPNKPKLTTHISIYITHPLALLSFLSVSGKYLYLRIELTQLQKQQY